MAKTIQKPADSLEARVTVLERRVAELERTSDFPLTIGQCSGVSQLRQDDLLRATREGRLRAFTFGGSEPLVYPSDLRSFIRDAAEQQFAAADAGADESDEANADAEEAADTLVRFRPATLGQASRLAGINPADVMLIAVAVRRGKKRGEARSA